nr:alcohol dehydrogenase catalytic domain-containing protein [Candidatus Sigynarchaeota archaeon]
MRAVVFEDTRKLVYREDYPTPVPGPGEVLVRVKYCGICGTDLHNYADKMYQAHIVMGHEFSGEVVAVGEGMQHIPVGTRGVGINVALDLNQGDSASMGIMSDGGFAELVRVREQEFFPIPDKVTFPEGAMIETFAVAVRAMKKARMHPRARILIIGGGTIGLTNLAVLKAAQDPDYILVVEPQAFLREKAKELGATDAAPPSAAVVKRFMKQHGDVDIVFDCAGNEMSLSMAMNMVKRGGTIVWEGIHLGKIQVPIMLLNSREICLQGTLSHDREDITDAIAMVAGSRVDAKRMISEVVPLADLPATFERALNPETRQFVKILVQL